MCRLGNDKGEVGWKNLQMTMNVNLFFSSSVLTGDNLDPNKILRWLGPVTRLRPL